MKIKKTYQGVLPENKILNTESTSQTDTYSCDYINEQVKEVYSTEEVRIGTWIDGKPLYRKVFNVGNLGNYSALQVNHGLTNVNIVRAEGIGISTTGGRLPLPYVAKEYPIELFVNSTIISLATYNDRTMVTAYITVEYTKTTD